MIADLPEATGNALSEGSREGLSVVGGPASGEVFGPAIGKASAVEDKFGGRALLDEGKFRD